MPRTQRMREIAQRRKRKKESRKERLKALIIEKEEAKKAQSAIPVIKKRPRKTAPRPSTRKGQTEEKVVEEAKEA